MIVIKKNLKNIIGLGWENLESHEEEDKSVDQLHVERYRLEKDINDELWVDHTGIDVFRNANWKDGNKNWQNKVLECLIITSEFLNIVMRASVSFDFVTSLYVPSN